MLRLHVAGTWLAPGRFGLPAGAARHVQVRRLQPGDVLVLFDGSGPEWPAEVLSIGRSEVQVEVQPARWPAIDRELALTVTICVGVPAGERMDWLVEKATELGAARIRPLICERSVLRVEGERAGRKQAHWQAVAVAAAEQCGRARVPVVDAPRGLAETLAEALADPAPRAERWLLAPDAPGASLQRPASASIELLSGPEGGFSSGEVQAALSAGYKPVGLGPRELRAETAPLAALAWLGLAL